MMVYSYWKRLVTLSITPFVGHAVGLASTKLDSATFASTLETGLWLVKFHSPASSASQTLAPTWSAFVAEYSSWGEARFNFAEMDCVENHLKCLELGVREFPVFVLYKDGARQANECSFADSKDDLVDCLDAYAEQLGLEPAIEARGRRLQAGEGNMVEAESAAEKADESLQLNPIITENVDGKVAALTADNFDKEVERGPWFVKFFAPWCGHCQKATPTWEKLAQDMKGVVNIGQVDCTTDKAICDKNAVRGYPTLKIMGGGKDVEYTGERELKAFSQTLMKKFGQKPTISPQEATEKISREEVALVVYNPISHDFSAKPVSQVLSDVEVDLDAYFVKGYWPNQEAYNLHHAPSLLIIKDGRVVEFTGSLSNFTEMVEWVKKEQHPIVRTIDPDGLRKLLDLNEGLAVVKIGHGVTREKDAKSFRNFAEPILRRDPNPEMLYFGILDADHSEFRQWFMLPKEGDPVLKLLDLKSKKFYSTNVYGISFGFDYEEIREAIKAQRAGKLTQGFALKFGGSSFLPFALTLVLPVLLFLGIGYVNLAADSQDSAKKSN